MLLFSFDFWFLSYLFIICYAQCPKLDATNSGGPRRTLGICTSSSHPPQRDFVRATPCKQVYVSRMSPYTYENIALCPCDFSSSMWYTRFVCWKQNVMGYGKTLMNATVVYLMGICFLTKMGTTYWEWILHMGMGCAFWKQNMEMYWKAYWNRQLFDVLPTMAALWVRASTLGNPFCPKKVTNFPLCRVKKEVF